MGSDSIIVFLDADPKRAAIAYNRMVDEDRSRTFWVKSVEEALDLLENYRQRLDIVSLEHDLNEDGYSHPSSPESGTEIVRWLEQRDSKDYSHVRFIMHTWNTSAGKRMTVRLRDAGYRAIYAPFGSEVTY